MKNYMEKALEEAKKAALRGEVPVGAVIVQGQKIIAQAGNALMMTHDPTAHAEIVVLRQACLVLQSHRLDECDVYVTLEPCAMCAHGMALSRVRRLYFGAYDVKAGGVDHGPRVFNHSLHKPEVYGGIQEQACQAVLQEFFQEKRGK